LIGVGFVKVDRDLDQTESQQSCVEIEIALRIPCYGSNVMDAEERFGWRIWADSRYKGGVQL
jgi:hypothetical protein